jgi:NAD(P)H-hydrate epimerase
MRKKHLEDNNEKARYFSPRPRDAHKGDFGHVLAIGGNRGMGGAIRLAAEAAARVGAGLVTVATRAEHVPALIAARPELMCYPIKTSTDLSPLLARATVILLGPGLGQDAWAKEVYERAVESHLPKIVDADALNLLSLSQTPLKNTAQHHWILTPHPGEAARLLDTTTAIVQADRLVMASELQRRYSGIVVLKGMGTIVQGNTAPFVCAAGNPGMASGGMGDVLGGVIVGLLAQGFSLDEAARVGVQIHALAADQAAAVGERGLLAMDLMPYLRKLVNKPLVLPR